MRVRQGGGGGGGGGGGAAIAEVGSRIKRADSHQPPPPRQF